MPPDGEHGVIAEQLETLAERLRRLEPGAGGDAQPLDPNDPAAAPALAARAKDIVSSRKLRRSLFGAVPFADPAWDIMLDVTICELEGRPVAVSSVCVAAKVPSSTALRWVGDLVNIGILERWADPNDGRRNFLGLTAQARQAMLSYLSAQVRGRPAND